jgi:DNA-binding response OmpR family regulator
VEHENPQATGLAEGRQGSDREGGPATILVAEDEPAVRLALESLVRSWGYPVISVTDGEKAWEALQGKDPPPLAILDRMMPGMDGLEVCRRVRTLRPDGLPYMLLLTGREGRDDLIAGLEGGADAYVTKPIDPEELRARVRAGLRLVSLQSRLAERVRDLEATLRAERAVREDPAGLRATLRLCVAAFQETLTLDQIPRYLRAAHRLCAGLCQEALTKVGEDEAKDSD